MVCWSWLLLGWVNCYSEILWVNCWRLKIRFCGNSYTIEIGKWYKSGLFTPETWFINPLCVCTYVCMCMYMILCVYPPSKEILLICGREETTVQGNTLDEPDWSIIMILTKFGLRGPRFLAFLFFGPWTMLRPSPQHSDLFLYRCQWDPSPSLTHCSVPLGPHLQITT